MQPLALVPEGGGRRRTVAIALGVVLLQTAVMAANFAVIAPRFLGGADPFEPAPRTFALFLIVAPLEAALVVGLGLRIAAAGACATWAGACGTWGGTRSSAWRASA